MLYEFFQYSRTGTKNSNPKDKILIRHSKCGLMHIHNDYAIFVIFGTDLECLSMRPVPARHSKFFFWETDGHSKFQFGGIYINDIVEGVGSKKSRERVKVRSCDLKFPTHLNQNP